LSGPPPGTPPTRRGWELREHKARSPWNSPSDFVFPDNYRRRPRDRSAAEALLKRAIKRADVQLEKDGGDPIPEGVTFHSLRRSYATMVAEAGAAPAYVMGQIGHRRSSFTLDVYTDVTTRRDAAMPAWKPCFRPLKRREKAQTPQMAAPLSPSPPSAKSSIRREQGACGDGASGIRTRDLRLAKPALSQLSYGPVQEF
jgi:hypothetical protein